MTEEEFEQPASQADEATMVAEQTGGTPQPTPLQQAPSKQEPTYPSERMKRAAHMLFFKRGRIPGAKAWELKAGLGKSYQKVLDQLDESLKELDLEVKRVETRGFEDYESGAGGEDDRFRYFVRLRGTLAPKEARMSGWRIDNLAALAACLALVVSKQGKAERKEVEAVLAEKAGRWRTLTLMDTFLRTGYLEMDDDGNVTLGWRTRAEIDLQSLMMLVAEAKPEEPHVESLEEPSIETEREASTSKDREEPAISGPEEI